MLLSSRIILQTVFLIHLTLTSGAHLRRGGAPGISRRTDDSFPNQPADPVNARKLSIRVFRKRPTVDQYKWSDEFLEPLLRQDEFWSPDHGYISECEGGREDTDWICTIQDKNARGTLAGEALEFFKEIDNSNYPFHRDQTGWKDLTYTPEDSKFCDWVYVYFERVYDGHTYNYLNQVNPEDLGDVKEEDPEYHGPKYLPNYLHHLITLGYSRGSVQRSIGAYTYHAGFFSWDHDY
ncbi:MAG: hypothetical protein M1837_005949 [Sclerophora amabilis]|nr:MAG: hypothetical protein M1837_005949 [Sclerophora amabilis]